MKYALSNPCNVKKISTICKLKIGSRCNLATPDLGVMQRINQILYVLMRICLLCKKKADMFISVTNLYVRDFRVPSKQDYLCSRLVIEYPLCVRSINFEHGQSSKEK